MRLIAHRGNVDGPGPHDNDPQHIGAARALGFEVEVDLWAKAGELWLGHDAPRYRIDIDFLRPAGTWVHCKNVAALAAMQGNHDAPHFFWHDNDAYALTSRGVIWTYPGQPLVEGAIAVCPELTNDWDLSRAGGVCSDHVLAWRANAELTSI